MSKPSFVSLFLLLFCVFLFQGETHATDGKAKPNVLLILVDDLKPVLGCYGDPVAKTPHLDALAARGMRFDLAYCNQAVCAPSRFTLMLGSHSTSTGLYGLGSPLRGLVPDAVTLPQFFAKHGGYRTESLGKVYHIGHGNHGDPASFSAPHFPDKVIEYHDPASKPDGKLTREEAMFQNVEVPNFNALPRGRAFESPDVPDNTYADGRVAAETVSASAPRKNAGPGTGRRFLSPPDSPVPTCPSVFRKRTGISTTRRRFRCRSSRICRPVHPGWPTSAVARSAIISRRRTRVTRPGFPTH